MIEWLHPGLILIIGALFVPLFKGKWKQAYLIVPPVAAFIDVVLMYSRDIWRYSFLGMASAIFRIRTRLRKSGQTELLIRTYI